MKPTHNLSYGEEYTDRRSGEKKTRWVNVGVLMADEVDGRMRVKLSAVPVNFSGWLSVFPIDNTSRFKPDRLPNPEQVENVAIDLDSLPF